MASERRRRTVFTGLLVAAVLGAMSFMASVLVDDMGWRIALQIVGLTICALASGSAVLTVRRWSADDDFWWIDSERDPDH
jgi:hypothetical protein